MIFHALKTNFQKIRDALAKTRSKIGARLIAIFGKPLGEDALEELEALLYSMDLGSSSIKKLLAEALTFAKKNPHPDPEALRKVLEKSIADQLASSKYAPISDGVWLIVGVNGSGKTTTTAKLAALLQKSGKKVCVAACDTFRAAASTQLAIWSQRVGFHLVEGKPMSDPASVAFEALSFMQKEEFDILLIDTAGRLESKEDLMQELAKIRRTLTKKDPAAPCETLLILDATIGQTALEQARKFHAVTPLTGLIMSKLDGSAKGGVLVPIHLETHLPIRWLGVGEASDDLIPFEPEAYAKALFE